MAFKEGVSEEAVHKFREFVALVRELDSDVDKGNLTPDEAVDKAVEALGSFEGITVEDPPKATKKTKTVKESAD